MEGESETRSEKARQNAIAIYPRCGYGVHYAERSRVGESMTEEAAQKIIDDFKGIYGDGKKDVLFVKQLALAGFVTEEIATVLQLVQATCTYCFDDKHNCHCWNDE